MNYRRRIKYLFIWEIGRNGILGGKKQEVSNKKLFKGREY
jgi:hypothetical protein